MKLNCYNCPRIVFDSAQLCSIILTLTKRVFMHAGFFRVIINKYHYLFLSFYLFSLIYVRICILLYMYTYTCTYTYICIFSTENKICTSIPYLVCKSKRHHSLILSLLVYMYYVYDCVRILMIRIVSLY